MLKGSNVGLLRSPGRAQTRAEEAAYVSSAVVLQKPGSFLPSAASAVAMLPEFQDLDGLFPERENACTIGANCRVSSCSVERSTAVYGGTAGGGELQEAPEVAYDGTSPESLVRWQSTASNLLRAYVAAATRFVLRAVFAAWLGGWQRQLEPDCVALTAAASPVASQAVKHLQTIASPAAHEKAPRHRVASRPSDVADLTPLEARLFEAERRAAEAERKVLELEDRLRNCERSEDRSGCSEHRSEPEPPPSVPASVQAVHVISTLPVEADLRRAVALHLLLAMWRQQAQHQAEVRRQAEALQALDVQRLAAVQVCDQRTWEVQQMVQQAQVCLQKVQNAEATILEERARADASEARAEQALTQLAQLEAVAAFVPECEASSLNFSRELDKALSSSVVPSKPKTLALGLLQELDFCSLRQCFYIWRQFSNSLSAEDATAHFATPVARGLETELQDARHDLERCRTTDWELRRRLARQRELLAGRCAMAFSRASLRATLLAWRLSGVVATAMELAQERLISSVALAEGDRLLLHAGLAAWTTAAAALKQCHAEQTVFTLLTWKLGVCSAQHFFAAWQHIVHGSAALTSKQINTSDFASNGPASEDMRRGCGDRDTQINESSRQKHELATLQINTSGFTPNSSPDESVRRGCEDPDTRPATCGQQKHVLHEAYTEPLLQDATGCWSLSSCLWQAFCSWRLLLSRKVHLEACCLRRLQANSHMSHILLLTMTTWCQYAQKSRSMRWSCSTRNLALLRAVLGTWRLAVFEQRSLQVSGCTTPQLPSQKSASGDDPAEWSEPPSDVDGLRVLQTEVGAWQEAIKMKIQSLQLPTDSKQAPSNQDDCQRQRYETQSNPTPKRWGRQLRQESQDMQLFFQQSDFDHADGTRQNVVPQSGKSRTASLAESPDRNSTLKSCSSTPRLQRLQQPSQKQRLEQLWLAAATPLDARANSLPKSAQPVRHASATPSQHRPPASARRSSSTPRLSGYPKAAVSQRSSATLEYDGGPGRPCGRYSHRTPSLQQEPLAKSRFSLHDLKVCHTPTRPWQRNCGA